VVRWGKQPGSIYVADQKLAIMVPRVRDLAASCELPLPTYTTLQTPRAQDVGLFRRVLGGLSCREYEAAAEAVPEAFGLARSSVSRRFIRASARELRQLGQRSARSATSHDTEGGRRPSSAVSPIRLSVELPTSNLDRSVRHRGLHQPVRW
jgi:hypothetical protein